MCKVRHRALGLAPRVIGNDMNILIDPDVPLTLSGVTSMPVTWSF
jgi:hypothetical protein